MILLCFVSLTGCAPADRESTLDNAVALFVTNGVKRTPILDEEIIRAMNSIFSFSHLEEAFNEARIHSVKIEKYCSITKVNPSGVEQNDPFERLKARITALQIIAYQNHWPVERRFRFSPGELSCKK